MAVNCQYILRLRGEASAHAGIGQLRRIWQILAVVPLV